MKLSELVKILNSMAVRHRKRIFTLRELSTFSGETKASCGMTLLRARKEGLVDCVKNQWVNLMDRPALEELAFAIKNLSYISFESALYRHGILSQSPRGALTVATLQRPARISTPLGKIQYIHLPKKLFFGFDSARVATPEKAILDWIYIGIRQGRSLTSEVTYISELDKRLLKKLAGKFPAYVWSGFLKNF